MQLKRETFIRQIKTCYHRCLLRSAGNFYDFLSRNFQNDRCKLLRQDFLLSLLAYWDASLFKIHCQPQEFSDRLTNVRFQFVFIYILVKYDIPGPFVCMVCAYVLQLWLWKTKPFETK